MSDIWALLLIGAIGIAIGAAIGILASGGRGVKTEDKKLPESTPDQLVEVFRLWRDPAQMGFTLRNGWREISFSYGDQLRRPGVSAAQPG